jgi:hypothetical protein
MSVILATVLSKITQWWRIILGVLVAMIPVIAYIFGRKDGTHREKLQRIEDAARAERNRAEFYKDLGEAQSEAQINRPVSRDDIVERLRKNGL